MLDPRTIRALAARPQDNGEELNRALAEEGDAHALTSLLRHPQLQEGVVSLIAGDWVSYEVNVVRATKLEIVVASISAEECKIAVSIDEERAEVQPSGDGRYTGTSTSAITPGRHRVRIECTTGEVSICWLVSMRNHSTRSHHHG